MDDVLQEEVLIPFGQLQDRLTSELRSTLLTTSLRSLRAHGVAEAYLKLLPEEHRSTITDIVAGVWLPIDVGMAHYRACDALGLSNEQILSIGRDVGNRIQGTILGLMVRTAKSSGLTPWAGLRNCPLFYDRMFSGGSVSLVKLGPKEARIAIVANPLCGIPYFRAGLRSIVTSGSELFCEKAYSHELPRYTSETSLGIRLSWA